MLTKRLNSIIVIVSNMLSLLVILCFAVLAANLFWWIFDNSNKATYAENASANKFDNSIRYIINRYPFGVVVEEKTVNAEIPSILSQITVSGIYFNPPNSIVFIEYNNDSHMAKIGDNIMGNATIKAIGPDDVVLVQNGKSVTAHIKAGTEASANASGNSSTASGNSNSSTFTRPTNTSTLRNEDTRRSADNQQANEFSRSREQFLEEYNRKQSQRLNSASSLDNRNNSDNSNASDNNDNS